MSLSRALKVLSEPSRIPLLFVDTKLESTRALENPSSTRMPALKRCPVIVF